MIATPIGNLADVSQRCRDALVGLDVLGCEDTRRTGKLLALLAIPAPKLVVVNEHTEMHAARRLVDELSQGRSVGLVSDAGMPGISDPGQRVVALARAEGFDVEVIPGPVAAMLAVVGSGFEARRFVFEGFLDRKGPSRAERLQAISRSDCATVLYEAPHRVVRTLEDLAQSCGGVRRVAIARELTKRYEQWWIGPLAQAADWAGEHAKGEFVLVVEAAPQAPDDPDELDQQVSALLACGLGNRDVAAAIHALFGTSKNAAYRRATARSQDLDG